LPPALSLPVLEPCIGGFIVLSIPAFAEWPGHKYGPVSMAGGEIWRAS